MTGNLRSMQVGAATLYVIELGALQMDLASWLKLPREIWPPQYVADLQQPVRIPIQCVLIALHDSAILVDACHAAIHAFTNYVPADYQAPPNLVDQLASLGVHPGDIQHVVITHAHFDHYSGIVQQQDGQDMPCFPNARHYLGHADWDDAQSKLEDTSSLECRALGMLHRDGLLALVDQNLDLNSAVQIIPAPGETRGHQIVRIHSDGQTAYCLGDLYHHPIEIDHPEWRVYWADAETTKQSRRKLTESALAEQALLIATHIRGVGRLRQTAAGVEWDNG